MVVKPKFRGFICTTAHPVGCGENVQRAAAFAEAQIQGKGPGRVLVVGSSTGYGLASRIAAAFGYGADTVGVFFDRPASGNRTGTAGWYNNKAFEDLAREKGLACPSINGDAFSPEVKAQTIAAIKEQMPGGQVDLILYSVAAPKRLDPATGTTWQSVLKPIGDPFRGKTVDFHTGAVTETAIDPATKEEIEGTVHVMGGEDWLLWIRALQEAGVVADGAATLAYTYIGPSLTHQIYRNGTIGRAKSDLERAAGEIDSLLAQNGGKAFVAVLKGVVTQSSAAIPVVPLYISLLFKIMKEKGTHEDCTAQLCRLLGQRLYAEGVTAWEHVPVDEAGRIRMDDLEMEQEVQEEILDLWERVNGENIAEVSDLAGYRRDFFRLFGFEVDGVDYEADVEV
jgi:enoyl-[acyl-carrier protein] reductase/trans-2-enoyl-CoA reductase (NAD+)